MSCTYDLVLLPVPDGRAEQTFYLVAGVIWVFTLRRRSESKLFVTVTQHTTAHKDMCPLLLTNH